MKNTFLIDAPPVSVFIAKNRRYLMNIRYAFLLSLNYIKSEKGKTIIEQL